jgi:hypothetical protein
MTAFHALVLCQKILGTFLNFFSPKSFSFFFWPRLALFNLINALSALSDQSERVKVCSQFFLPDQARDCERESDIPKRNLTLKLLLISYFTFLISILNPSTKQIIPK